MPRRYLFAVRSNVFRKRCEMPGTASVCEECGVVTEMPGQLIIAWPWFFR